MNVWYCSSCVNSRLCVLSRVIVFVLISLFCGRSFVIFMLSSVVVMMRNFDVWLRFLLLLSFLRYVMNLLVIVFSDILVMFILCFEIRFSSRLNGLLKFDSEIWNLVLFGVVVLFVFFLSVVLIGFLLGDGVMGD